MNAHSCTLIPTRTYIKAAKLNPKYDQLVMMLTQRVQQMRMMLSQRK